MMVDPDPRVTLSLKEDTWAGIDADVWVMCEWDPGDHWRRGGHIECDTTRQEQKLASWSAVPASMLLLSCLDKLKCRQAFSSPHWVIGWEYRAGCMQGGWGMMTIFWIQPGSRQARSVWPRAREIET